MELIAQNELLKAELAGKPEELDAATEQKCLYLPHKNGNGYYCGFCKKKITREISVLMLKKPTVYGKEVFIVQPTVEKEPKKKWNDRSVLVYKLRYLSICAKAQNHRREGNTGDNQNLEGRTKLRHGESRHECLHVKSR